MSEQDQARAEELRVPFPFAKVEAGSWDAKEWYRWKAGCRWEDGYSDREAVCDGMGEMILREIGRYTPPGYGQRVFYTRQFVSPTGEVWGNPKLRVMGAAGFTRLCKGYRYDVELVDARADVNMQEPVPDVEDYADVESVF